MTISTRKFYDTASKFTIGGSLDLSDVMPTGDDNNNSDTPEDKTGGSPEGDNGAEAAAKKPEADATDKTEGVDKKDDKTEKSDTTGKPTETAKPEATTAKKEVPTDWKSEVKKQNKADVLKELGLDEHVIKMIQYREENHDLTPFLRAVSADWDKVNDLDLVRDELRKEYPTLTDEEFNTIADDELGSKYYLESVQEGEKTRGKIKLKSDAAKIRLARKEEDKKFLDTIKPAEKAAQPTQEDQQAQAEQQRLAYAKQVEELPAAKKLVTDKHIETGSGFKYKVDSNAVLEVAKDPAKLFELFQKDGKEDWEGLFATIAFAMDRKNYDKLLTDHGKTLGSKEQIDEIDNADGPPAQTKQPKKKTIAQAFQDSGVEFNL